MLREHFVPLSKDQIMKKLFLVVFLLVSSLGVSQTGDRVMVNGKISVPLGDDPEGITILNVTTNRGTVSDDNGEFELPVAVGDQIHFSALQFQEFFIMVDRNVVESGQLNVFVNEAATELPEVVVSSIDLSGNVRVDLNRIPDPQANIPQLTTEDVYNASLEFEPGEVTTPENTAIPDRFMENGLNFVNIFKAIVSSRDTGDEDYEPLPGQIRDLYDDEFFREHLDIERTKINDFILYAEDNGLTQELLKDGNELDLIEFLLNQSKKFKAENQTN